MVGTVYGHLRGRPITDPDEAIRLEVFYGYSVMRPRPQYVDELAFSTNLPDMQLNTGMYQAQHGIASARACEYCATPHKSACCPSCGGPAPEGSA